MGSKRRIIRVGLIKAIPKKWDVKTNWAMFEKLAICAKEQGAQIICTPECFLDGYVAIEKRGWTKERFRKISQSLDSKSYLGQAMGFALEFDVHLVFGFTELAENGSYNAAALIDNKGKLLGCYHKTHLLNHDKRYLPGKELPVWETSLGKVGIMICADRRWPETARTLKVRGAEVIMNPSLGMANLDNEWWMRTRSYENELFICFTHARVVLITGPKGEIAAKLENNIPDVLIHDIDLSDIPNEMFKHRRTDVYEKALGKK